MPSLPREGQASLGTVGHSPLARGGCPSASGYAVNIKAWLAAVMLRVMLRTRVPAATWAGAGEDEGMGRRDVSRTL